MSGFPLLGTGVAGTPGGPAALSATGSVLSALVHGSTGVGVGSLLVDTGGVATAVGLNALAANTTGAATGVGYNAGAANTTGVLTALGNEALAVATGAVGATAVGDSCLRAWAAAGPPAVPYAVGVGNSCLAALTTGYATAVGQTALAGLTTGNGVAMGYQAGYRPLGNVWPSITGVGLTLIGNNTGAGSAADPSYITCLGFYTTCLAAGGVAIGIDHTGSPAAATLQDQIMLGTTNHTVYEAATNTAAGATASTPTFASGVASQLAQTTKDAMVYFGCTFAGTAFTLAIGPTSTPANTLITGVAVVAGQMISFRLPAGWYVKYTVTTGTFTQTAITC